jgi:hypothetical protein
MVGLLSRHSSSGTLEVSNLQSSPAARAMPLCNQPQRSGPLLVVKAALDNFEPLIFSLALDAIDQTVFAIDTTRPPAL